ncbi:MAG TPA: ABC transporter permease [Vicinamibacteria bacterium]|nr:ABC transporter permease [Vicinamibacteria bacterium]
MTLPFELRVALRYLTARRKQAFISVISGISILGVGVGVMAVLIALGLMTGLQTEVRSRILGATAHLSLFKGRSDAIEEYREVVEEVRKVARVQGAAPVVYGKGLLASSGGSAVATLKGIVPADERTVTELARQVEDGASLDALVAPAEGMAPILLGRDLAASLGVGPGDVVTVTSPQGRLSPMGVLPRMARFRVLGTVRSGLYEFDAEWAYLPLATAQRLFDVGDRASLVEVRVDDMYAVRAIADEVLRALGDGYITTDWIQMNQSLFSALWLEKTAITITIGLIVAVAALNIVATLILMVMEKHKDIGILVSMGAGRGTIAGIFMLQGTVIGAVGTVVGGLLGWGACRVLDRYRLIQVPQDVYQIAYVPFSLLPGDAAIVVFGALLTCFVATIHPARGAARVDPAEALRYE